MKLIKWARQHQKRVKRESDVKEFPKWNIFSSIAITTEKDENVLEWKMKVDSENKLVCDGRKQLAWHVVVGWAEKKYEKLFSDVKLIAFTCVQRRKGEKVWRE